MTILLDLFFFEILSIKNIGKPLLYSTGSISEIKSLLISCKILLGIFDLLIDFVTSMKIIWIIESFLILSLFKDMLSIKSSLDFRKFNSGNSSIDIGFNQLLSSIDIDLSNFTNKSVWKPNTIEIITNENEHRPVNNFK